MTCIKEDKRPYELIDYYPNIVSHRFKLNKEVIGKKYLIWPVPFLT